MKFSPEHWDVRVFHEKFKLLMGKEPQQLTKRKLEERIQFLQEELDEFTKATGLTKKFGPDGVNYWDFEDPQYFPGQADALVDLVYVALGTAIMMGLPWEELWIDVQRANMAKVRGETHRGHKVDVTKPVGWVPPKTEEILLTAGWVKGAPEVDDESA